MRITYYQEVGFHGRKPELGYSNDNTIAKIQVEILEDNREISDYVGEAVEEFSDEIAEIIKDAAERAKGKK